MQIVVNGEPRETVVRTLAELCAALEMGSEKIATAVNGTFVPERARAQLELRADDQIEIVSPRQGG